MGAGRVRGTEKTDGGGSQETGLWVNMTLSPMLTVVFSVMQPLHIFFMT